MSATREGGIKAAVTNKKLYGKNWYKEIGKSGGKAPHKCRGFQCMPREKIVAAGRKGGAVSRRKKNVQA